MTIPWSKTFAEAIRVMLAALILSGAGFIFRPHLRSMLVGGQSASETGMPGQETFATISLDEARAYFKAGTALFIDARHRKAYEAGHIPGSMSLDPTEFDSWSDNFFSQFPSDTLIVTYCDGGRCSLSGELARLLRSLGYDRVLIFQEGWSAWNAARLPAEQVAQ
jgi:rhodanese-related sulfurtransferase